MVDAQNSGRSKRVYLFILIGLVLLPVVAFSCHHYYEVSVNKSLVDQVTVSLPVLFDEKLENDTSLAQVRETRFSEALTEVAGQVPMLIEAYGKDNNEFRFIQDHVPTKTHSVVAQRVNALYDDGLYMAPFKIPEHEKLAAQLSSLNKKIEAASTVVVPEKEKDALFKELEAESDKAGKTLTPIEVLDLALLPKNEAKLPSIHNAWKEVFAFADKRALTEATLEADTGRWHFVMLEKMLCKEDLFMGNWDLMASNPEGAIEQIEPKVTHYAELKKGLKQYRQYAKTPYDDYGFKAGYGTKIKQTSKAAKGPLTVRIKKRLALEGYWNGDFEPVWDDALTAALTHYQENHQVVPDGVYGRGTAESFNITIQDRILQIRLAMERIRHSAGRWDDYYVRINVPEFGLELRENQKILKRHKIIVGNRAPKNHTPLFSDEIELVNFNPSWFVPERIIKEEMQPAFDKDEEYFKKKGYHAKVNDEGKVLAVTQPPGGRNALGNVKILFPNPHDVYLHDTSSRYLFKRTIRPFSHGCMRLQYAAELATFLLEKDGHEDVDKIPEYLEKRISKELYLKKKIPIHVEYALASTNEKGEVIFFGDVYKKEKETLLAMAQEDQDQ